MPYYTFDLVVGDEFRNETIILENISVAPIGRSAR